MVKVMQQTLGLPGFVVLAVPKFDSEPRRAAAAGRPRPDRRRRRGGHRHEINARLYDFSDHRCDLAARDAAR